MPIEKLRPSFSFDEERIKQLKQIAPEAFADNKINWEVLKEAFRDHLEEDDLDVEHFGLFWPGKREARRMASFPSKGTLIPCPGEGIDEENAHNIFIEGENLEVLKILQKSYAGRIKMIYIDPPYNTGNDFVYDDDFTEPLQEYLRRTDQIDEVGKPLTTNKRSDGRFHSKWLSMMYPRLRLARKLLSEDGFIFVSIDDNEFKNLRLIMDEIFGEENFISTIIWQHSIQPKGYLGKFSQHHNYIVCYSKDNANKIGFMKRTEEHNKNYSNPDNDPNGPWRSGDVRNALYRKNLIYDIKTPSGKIIKPPKNGWRWSIDTVSEKIKRGEIKFNKDETNIIRKIYLNNIEGRTPESIWFGKEVGTTRDGSNELKALYKDTVPFDTPKPSTLIERMIEISKVEPDDIILDFFAGSGSTGQAVINNSLSNKNALNFILVQMQEEVDEQTPSGRNAKKLKLNTIADICKDRIKRLIKLPEKSNKGKIFSQNILGLRVYKLNRTNFMAWKDYYGKDISELGTLFDESSNSLVENWQTENLITEILLIEGFPLDSEIEELKEYKKNKVQQVTSDFCEHRLLICLDNKVHPDIINNLQLSDTDIFICLDNAITDEEKVTLSDRGLLKTI